MKTHLLIDLELPYSGVVLAVGKLQESANDDLFVFLYYFQDEKTGEFGCVSIFIEEYNARSFHSERYDACTKKTNNSISILQEFSGKNLVLKI